MKRKVAFSMAILLILVLTNITQVFAGNNNDNVVATVDFENGRNNLTAVIGENWTANVGVIITKTNGGGEGNIKYEPSGTVTIGEPVVEGLNYDRLSELKASADSYNWQAKKYYTPAVIKISGNIPRDEKLIGKTIKYVVTFESKNTELNQKTDSITISVKVAAPSDSEKPTVNAKPSAGGWTNENVRVDINASDNENLKAISYKINDGAAVESTVSGKSASIVVSFENEGQHILTYWAADAQGNTSEKGSITVKIDKTKPTIIGLIESNPNEFGWHNNNVTVNFTAQDALSGINESMTDKTKVVSDNGANQSVAGSACDNAGNTNSIMVEGINIDKLAPTIEVKNIYGDSGNNGWYITPVTVEFNSYDQDGLSGINVAKTTDTLTLSREGRNQSIKGAAVDKAGNVSETQELNFNIDTITPSTEILTQGTKGNNDWYIDDVEVALTSTDETSGVAKTEYSFDGTNWVEYAGKFKVEREGKINLYYRSIDMAGNAEEAKSIVVNLDKTNPEITGAPTTPANEYGWYNTDVTVHFTGTDTISGIFSITEDQTISTEGADQSVTGTAVDYAGRTETAVVTGINIDKTAPIINGKLDNSPNENGWYNRPVTVIFTSKDELSGIAKATEKQIISTEGINQSATGTAVDKAGNTASCTIPGINIDMTKPVIKIDGISEGAVLKLNQAVAINYSAEDNLSGIAALEGSVPSGSTLDTKTVGEHTLSFKAVDKAGNTELKTIKYRVVYEFGGILKPINPDGSSVFKQGSTIPVKFQLKDGRGEYVTNAVAKLYYSKISNSISGTEDEAVSTAAATTGNLFRYDTTSNQYIFNLNTKNLTPGTYTLRIDLGDGTTNTVQISLR